MNTEQEYLRELARRTAELAHSPRMQKLKQEWTLHNKLEGVRPMICVSPEGSWNEIIPEESLRCTDPLLREFEYTLQQKLYWGNEIQDDTPVSDCLNIPYSTTLTGYGDGYNETKIQGQAGGSFHYVKLIESIRDDLPRLKYRQVIHNEAESRRRLELAQELFGGILNVRHRGAHWWTMGITSEVIKLIGLEDLMIDLYDDPEGLHQLMDWFCKEHLNLLDQYEQLGLLSMNNEDDMIASGGIGYSDQLPVAGNPVTCRDLWGFSESQETVGISPEMFGEFIFPYQLPILERFGINCYGCCEPVEKRWEWVRTIPRLRRVSVSPWSDREEMKVLLGKNYIFSRKPNPSYICNGFSEQDIRQELQSSLQLAKDVCLEIILKDTHTIQHQPERFHQWVHMAREIAERV